MLVGYGDGPLAEAFGSLKLDCDDGGLTVTSFGSFRGDPGSLVLRSDRIEWE